MKDIMKIYWSIKDQNIIAIKLSTPQYISQLTYDGDTSPNKRSYLPIGRYTTHIDTHTRKIRSIEWKTKPSSERISLGSDFIIYYITTLLSFWTTDIMIGYLTQNVLYTPSLNCYNDDCYSYLPSLNMCIVYLVALYQSTITINSAYHQSSS